MLDLHKASAGSGKTYTLARQYIEYLITTGRPPRLRSRSEIEDGLRHILAITFTNKATAEMKGRIVTQLAYLAGYTEPGKMSDYIDYFTDLLGVDRPAVEHTAAEALAILLNYYTDFQVSTIDAFFQTILRTFAFEIGLNDSYGLELDDDYIARSAIDSTLSDVNAEKADKRDTERWLIEMMKEGMDSGITSWNIFTKQGENSIYYKILSAVKNMSAESFKTRRDNLREFYSHRTDTLADFRALNNFFFDCYAAPVARAKKHAARLVQLQSDAADGLKKNEKEYPEKVLEMRAIGKEPFRMDKLEGKTPFKKGTVMTPCHEEYTAEFDAMLKDLIEWRDLGDTEQQRLWKAYRDRYKMLPMMLFAAEKSAEMLSEANMLNMSETNTILKKVIGDDDAPFIYERLGTRLEHYLIDEFQDTSKMQWDNLRPLLDESMSHGHSNLIIGDAKQSIYRFRNADPSLITSTVPEEYDGRINLRGDGRSTNFRSCRNIVEFNNSLFTCLAGRWDREQSDLLADGESTFFRKLYNGVEQKPNMKDIAGYVKMDFFAGEDAINEGIAPLISSLRQRGYHLADIAVLVSSNNKGREIVGSLLEYNLANPDDAIEFVSEESLIVGNAATVKVIISVLRLIAEGALSNLNLTDDPYSSPNAEETGDDGRKHRRKLSVALFNCRYQLVALAHPEFSVEEILNFMNLNKIDAAPLQQLIDAAGSLALPALIENIVMKFIDMESRRREAPFIAAIQDMVLDFCDRYPSDVLSFLQWWDAKGAAKSISTPEGVDAVAIMTVHKAKGLENQVIILPELKRGLKKTKGEWRWVKTDKATLGLPDELAALIPDYMPIEADESLLETPHADEYVEHVRQVRMDNLNSLYVACTRAVGELYILTTNQSDWATSLICEALSEIAEHGDDCEYGIHPELLKIETEGEGKAMRYTDVSYGKPLEAEQIQQLKSKLFDVRGEVITDYPVTDPTGVLRYRDPDDTARYHDDPDPRGFGNKLHNIMQHIFRVADIDKSVLEQVVAGNITDEEGTMAGILIKKKMSTPIYPGRADSPTVEEWFAPELRVINERSLLEPNRKMPRPDRIMVTPDGTAIVIDYKFGDEEREENLTQVRDYMTLLRRTGAFPRLRGYLWYVMKDRVIEVK